MNTMNTIEQARLIGRSIDPRGVLPPKARRKFERLKAERDEAEALASVNRARIERIESTFHAMNDADAKGGREELDELRVKRDNLNARRHLWAIERLAEWAAEHAHVGMIDAPPVTIPKGATIEGVREKIAGLRKELAQTGAAPKTAEELKADAGRWVADAARRAQPIVDGRTGGVTFPMGGVKPEYLAAWLDPEGMVAALSRDIEAVASPAAMTADAKRRKVRELEAALLEAERVEENLIEAAAGQIERRNDASPAAILGVITGRVAARAA